MAQFNYHHTSSIVTQVAILWPVCLLAVTLRFWARAKTDFRYGADDWFAVAALVFFLLCGAVTLWIDEHGGKGDLKSLPYPVLVKYLKGVYVAELFPTISIAAAKFSILCLYRRLFSSNRGFRIAVIIVEVVNALWAVACILGLCLKCLPVEKSWNQRVPGHCFNDRAFLVAIEVPNSLVDFVMVGLPLGVLKGLSLPLRHKISVGLIFFLGSFVGIIGFIRIGITYTPKHYSIHVVFLWLNIQAACAVICCCLPTYRPLFPSKTSLLALRSRCRYLFPKDHLSASSDSKTAADGSVGNTSMRYKRYDNLGDEEGENRVLTRAEGGGSEDGRSVAGRDYPLNAIRVKSTVRVDQIDSETGKGEA